MTDDQQSVPPTTAMRKTPPPTLKSASTTVLPDIPQLPPLTLTSSPSIESFATALTRPFTPIDAFSFGSPTSTSSSAGGVSYSYASTSPPLRGTASVQHLRLSDPDDEHDPPPPVPLGNWIRIPPATTYDSEGGGSVVTSRAYSTASLSRGNMSDGASTSKGATMSDGQTGRIRREGSGVSLPAHTGGARVSGRSRSASLLGMVSTANGLPPMPAPSLPPPRSSASMQNLQQAANPRPRLMLRPPTSTDTPSGPPDFTLLVIGSPGAGKSVLISKALKSWGLEKERPITLGGSIKGIARTAHVGSGNSGNEEGVEVIECPSTELVASGGRWPGIIAKGRDEGGGGEDPTTDVDEVHKTGKGRVIDAVVVVYDSADSESWEVAKVLLDHASKAYTHQPVQGMVIACKTDLIHPPVPADHTEYHPLLSSQSAEVDKFIIGVDPTPLYKSHTRPSNARHSEDDGHDKERPHRRGHWNVGLIPVARTEGQGKKKMRDAFHWLLKRVERAKRHNRLNREYEAKHPSVLIPIPQSPPPTATGGSSRPPSKPSTPVQESTPLTPPMQDQRTRSVSDLRMRDREFVAMGLPAKADAARSRSSSVGPAADPSRSSGPGGVGLGLGVMGPPKVVKEPPPMQFASFDELLDKLVFLAVTEDDQVYIDQFLLIFRRFATPRSLLLGMQRRMRELSASGDDPLLAKFAQIRICGLLLDWITTYPGDFASPGAEPALSALVKQILSHPHTAHYATELLPFVDAVPDLVDEDKAWAFKDEARKEDTSDVEEEEEEEREALQVARSVGVSIAVSLRHKSGSVDSLHSPPLKNGSTSSVRLPPKSPHSSLFGEKEKEQTTPPLPPPRYPLKGMDAPPGARVNLKDLVKVSTAVIHQPPQSVAEEITRLEVPLFLDVQPRDWLRHTFARRGGGGTPTLQRMAKFFNYISMWCASLILVHDKPRLRSKTIEFFIRVALILRKMNNYSALRAIVAGIIISRTDRENDPVMFHLRDRQVWKKDFKSLETLLAQSRMHGAYRMALKHTFDAAVPSMEVHTYDLIRADENNPDFKPDDDQLVHWGKFSLIAKLILNIVEYQERFEDSSAFQFVERPDIRDLVMNVVIYDEDTMYARVALHTEANNSGPLSDTGGQGSRFRQIFARR